MAGIYIHIPFCSSKCHYCDFFSVASVRQMDEMVNAIASELKLRASYLKAEEIQTIYFGGGTPSLLSEMQLQMLFDVLYSYYRINPDAEITLESNPDDLSENKIEILKQSQVNRLSIGIQSFFEEDLHFLGRRHSAGQTYKVLEQLQKIGFNNLSIDFIFGMQSLSDKNLLFNLQTAANFRIPHISAYSLTVEEKTALYQFIQKGKIADVDEEKVIRQFLLCSDFLQNAGYDHYEISNFALSGNYSKHNSAYWKGGHYLGAGPSAHSFNGHSRQWNVSSIQKYILKVKGGEDFFEKEELSESELCNEYIFTALRTMWGIDLNLIQNRFGKKITDHLLSGSASIEKRGLIKVESDKIILTREGKLFTDSISTDLMIE